MVRDLRARCPWDRAQTRETLRPYLVEEVLELDHAIGHGDADDIRGELGDVLLNLAFQLVIAEERGEFTADRVADGHYAIRVQEHGPPPMRALARSFNTMAGRLESANRVRRDLMADVAHELRTPLAVLQGRLEGLLDGVYPPDDQHLSQLLEETRVGLAPGVAFGAGGEGSVRICYAAERSIQEPAMERLRNFLHSGR
jgi:NTP pyrophosphatase (non-canonical NTP hydrolase)